MDKGADNDLLTKEACGMNVRCHKCIYITDPKAVYPIFVVAVLESHVIL
jgi:hypothetical protein